MDFIGTRIKGIELIRRKLKDYILFREDMEGMSFAVPAGRSHQIISDGGRDKGIVFGKNGETDFRKYNREIVYWYNGSDNRAYIIDSRKKDTLVLE